MASRGIGAPGRRSALCAIFVILGLTAGLAPTSARAIEPDDGFEFRDTGSPPLTDARTYVLQGVKLARGGCRYAYPTGPAVIPPNGWEMRTVAIDMDGCRKLIEEGTPTDPAFPAPADGMTSSAALPTAVAAKSNVAAETIQAAALSTRSAWQRSLWKDPIGVMMTNEATEITWTYNGSTVSSGSTRGFFYNIPTWSRVSSSTTQGFFSGAFRGQTVSTFKSSACVGLPTVYTYYYYNRVYGHYDGTATTSESSDSVDECLPFFKWVHSGYGTYPYA